MQQIGQCQELNKSHTHTEIAFDNNEIYRYFLNTWPKKIEQPKHAAPCLPAWKTGRQQICLNVDNRLNPCQDHYLIRSMQIELRYKINLFV